jgi:hypothetical protein
MFTATAGVVLPTTIIGSLPRPGWYTQNLGRREFREAMVDRTYREQYLDAASSYLRDQELAGLDIVTDGDCRFDADVAGHNWFSYAPLRMSGFAGGEFYRAGGKAGFPHKPGHILHDVLEDRNRFGDHMAEATLRTLMGQAVAERVLGVVQVFQVPGGLIEPNEEQRRAAASVHQAGLATAPVAVLRTRWIGAQPEGELTGCGLRGVGQGRVL